MATRKTKTATKRAKTAKSTATRKTAATKRTSARTRATATATLTEADVRQEAAPARPAARSSTRPGSPRPAAASRGPLDPESGATDPAGRDDLLGRIVELLEVDEAERRRSAAVVLGALAVPDDGTLDALRRACRRADDAVLRARSAEALGALAPDSLVHDLMPLLKDPETSVRETVRRVLATGKRLTKDDIATMLSAKDERQRAGAIAVLGAIGTPEAQDRILDQLTDGSSRIWEAVQDALHHIYSELDEMPARAAATALTARLDELDLEAAGRCRVMVELWSALGHPEAAEGLCTIAATPTDDGVRLRALEVLRTVVRGRRQAISVFSALLALLEAPDTPPSLLGPICDALAGIDLPMNLERRVRALLTSETTPVRRWAIRALGGLDSAPAARAVAEVAQTGDATDRQVALEVGVTTPAGRTALARQLIKMADGSRAQAAASALKPHVAQLPKSTLDALSEAAVEAPEEVGTVIIALLKHGGIDSGRAQESLFDRAMALKEEGAYAEAVALLRRIGQGAQATAEAKFQLGVCELMMSRRKISRGPNRDPCLSTFHGLSRTRDFRLIDRLMADELVGDEELYYLGFSLAEGGEDTQGLGGDLLMMVAESSDARLNRMAKNKLMTMGWLEEGA